MSELLMKLQSNKLLAADLRPSVLYIYDDKLAYYSNVGAIGGQETYLNYDQVAQVNLHRGFIEGTLEIVNSGGRNSIRIEHVTNDEAEKAKALIEQRAFLARQGTSNTLPTPPMPSNGQQLSSTQNDSSQTGVQMLDDLARLRDQGILTQEEFEEKKRQVLDRM